jgi:hypothetical protein
VPCTETPCKETAYDFCIVRKNGHWATKVTIGILHDAVETLSKERKEAINALLIDYLQKVRSIESSQRVLEKERAITDAATDVMQTDSSGVKTTPMHSKSLGKNPHVGLNKDLRQVYLSPVDIKVPNGELEAAVCKNPAYKDPAFVKKMFPNLDIDRDVLCADGLVDAYAKMLGVDENRAPWIGDEKLVVDDIKSQDANRLLGMINRVRGMTVEADRAKLVQRMIGSTGFCVGVNRKNEWVKDVLEKALSAVDTGKAQYNHFPASLPVSARHMRNFVEKVYRPSSTWLVYPYDMNQTRSKLEDEHLRDMKVIINEVDTVLILKDGGAEYFDEYLNARCLPLASLPGKDLLEDTTCMTWLRMEDLKTDTREKVIRTFCEMKSDEHAGSPECSCFWMNSSNDAPWKDAYGKKNFDDETHANPVMDEQKRKNPPICAMLRCQANGFRIKKFLTDMKDLCPKCVQVNSGNGSNINQKNSCIINTSAGTVTTDTVKTGGRCEQAFRPQTQPDGTPTASSFQPHYMNGSALFCAIVMIVVLIILSM